MSKYRNKKTVINGITFDSKAEAERYAQLLLMERAGEIRNLSRQSTFELIPKQKAPSGKTERGCKYIADFAYFRDQEFVIEDVKGKTTPDYIIKRKLMLQVHGIEIREIK